MEFILYSIINNSVYIFISSMKSSQLLQALNMQSHSKHQTKSKPLSLETIPQKNESLNMKDNQFAEIKLPSKMPEPPAFLKQILLQQQLNQKPRQRNVYSIINDGVTKLRKQREKNVYIKFNDSHVAYLEEANSVALKKNEYAAKCINDIMQRRYNMVLGDLQNGKLLVNHDRSLTTKDQVEKFAQLDRARLLKIKEGAIRSKLQLLNEKMQQMQKIHQSPPKSQEDEKSILAKKLQQAMDSSNYRLQSQRTKIAKDYVKYMVEQKRQRKKRQQQREERRKKQQQQRQAELKQAEQMKDLAKKQQILQKIEQKRKKRQQQQRQFEEKQKEIEKFLEKYRQEMPVFKKKEKQFEEHFLKNQNAYRQQKLKEIKQKKKSYSLNDIATHEKKYEELRKKDTERKMNEKQLHLKSLRINTKDYYRGSIHKIVEEVDRGNRQKNIALYQLGKNKKDRMSDYGNIIKQQYKPKLDEKKKSELMKLIQSEEMKKNNMIKKYKPVIDSSGQQIGVETYYEEKKPKNRYYEGNKFMEEGNLKRKKNLSYSVDASALQQNKTEEKQKQQNLKLLRGKSEMKEKVDYDKDIWKIRSKQIAEMSNNLSSPKQFEQVKLNFENLDRKAAQKQSLMKHAKLSVQEFIEQKGALDQFYLESIKNKIKLLE